MRTGEVTVHPLDDGVQPMPPSVLYPDVPMAARQHRRRLRRRRCGLSAVMAAVVAGATRIIVSDVEPSRLDLAPGSARPTSSTPPAAPPSSRHGTHRRSGRRVQRGMHGHTDVMAQAVAALAPLGSAAILAVAAGAQLRTDAFALLEGRSVTGSIVGHQAPAVLVPRILDLHGKGRFPLDALIRTYPLDDIGKAVDDVRSGAAVKAVLITEDERKHRP